MQTVADDLMDCWEATADSDGDDRPDTVYNMTLTVIECPGKNVANCSKLVGAVNVNMVWMIRNAKKDYSWVPTEMSGPDPFPDWVCPDRITGGLGFDDLSTAQKEACWLDFIDHFNLVTFQGTSIANVKLNDIKKTLFFVPDCDTHVPIGLTAGPNLGVLARIPVLVK